jgi:hypothetical protein
MMLQGQQTIDLKYPRDHLFTRYAESHGQLLARRLEAWSSALTHYWIVEYGPNALGRHRTPPPTGLALELERTRRATTRPRFAIRDHSRRELFRAP